MMAEPTLLGLSVTDLIGFIIVVLVTIALAKGTNMLTRRFLDGRISRTESKAVARLLQYSVLALGLYLGFWEVLGLDMTALLASLGILGLGVALASQQVLMNAFSGILMSFTKPVKIDEWVEISGVPATGIGKVKDINLMNTVLKDLDGRILYVPNSVMVNNKVINYSRAGIVAIRIPLWLRSLKDIDRIKVLILDVADKDPLILPHVGEEEQKRVNKTFELSSVRKYLEKKTDMSIFAPSISIKDIQREKVKVEIMIWIRDISKRDEIVTSYLDALRLRFAEEGIEFGDD
ncbi:MAG TPA: mechanosensitive ion channel [Methanomassiliicoccales archaeon]|nr:mechanosensitive ion channel [Methanomassiliicoccales archaeon]HSA35867.1 mechanosensitive ion channel [Methanomassiliicoccales archaeon]